jgi:hypothetical protein
MNSCTLLKLNVPYFMKVMIYIMWVEYPVWLLCNISAGSRTNGQLHALFKFKPKIWECLCLIKIRLVEVGAWTSVYVIASPFNLKVFDSQAHVV